MTHADIALEYAPRGVAIDPSMRPQDDLYGFVNNRWIASYDMQPHQSEVTMLSALSDKVQASVALLIREAVGQKAGSEAAKQISALYECFMDEQSLSTDWLRVCVRDLDRIRDCRTSEDLARVLGRLQLAGVPGVVAISVSSDPRQPEEHLLTLSTAALGLPKSAMYLQPEYRALQDQYLLHLETMFAHVGLSAQDASAAASDVLRLDRELATCLTDDDGQPTAPPPTTRFSLADLGDRTGGFPWRSWFRGLGHVPSGASICFESARLPVALDRWWGASDLSSLRTWATWRYLHEMAQFGPAEVFSDNFRFYGQILNGFAQPRPRPIRAVSLVDTFLGAEIGERYVARHLKPGVVDSARALVEELVESYRLHIEAATWMHASTRRSAVAKLEGMRFEIGARRNDEAGPDLIDADGGLLGKVKRGREWQVSRELARLRDPVDRSAWMVQPHQVTAYYRHSLNQVVIPAALLQSPIYSDDAEAAKNFGLFGAIVCHEMSHAFYGRGSRYDALGRHQDWWSTGDREHFRRRSALLVDQFGGYQPLDAGGRRVNGARTLAENVADITGLRVAQTAYSRYLCGRGTKPAEEFWNECMRHFFVYWASMWQAKTTPARAAERLVSDRHAPPEFRCNGVVAHLDSFYTVFDVDEKDRMYIPPGSRFSFL